MLLKSADDKSGQVTELRRLLDVAPEGKREAIERELRFVRAGADAEEKAAYLIDFDLKQSHRTAVIHDLRIEVDGRVAQIDHLLIHHTLNVFVLETKSFQSGLRVKDDGSFERWNDFKKVYEGMPSPFAQNERHIAVLKDAFAQIEMPSRLGLRLTPVFHSFVLVSPNARIERPKKFDTSKLIKADMLKAALDQHFDQDGALGTLGSLGRLVSAETLADISKRIIRLHRPFTFDFAAKFGISDATVALSSQPVVDPEEEGDAPSSVESPAATAENGKPRCRKCGADNVSVQYGKFGYYFKCRRCDGNTPIKIGCGREGHKERIRKEGRQFFRECSSCGSSRLFFTNPA